MKGKTPKPAAEQPSRETTTSQKPVDAKPQDLPQDRAKWASLPCPLIIDTKVVQAIRRHGRSNMQAEVCGVLIGEEIPEGTRIEAAIAGENAAQGGAHVTFTQDTWEHIYSIKDRDYPEKRIVGWYHTHPGFGIFLSKHDTFIHENFFTASFQVAWVYDPHSEEEGCFGWVDGTLRRLGAIRVIDSRHEDEVEVREEPDPLPPADEDASIEDSPEGKVSGLASRWRKRAILLFSLALVFVAGLAAGIMVLPRTLVMYSLPDGRLLTESEAREAVERALELQRQRRADPSGTETIQPPKDGETAPPNPAGGNP